MAKKKTKPEEPTADESCPTCGGYGLIVAKDGSVTRCSCGAWDTEQFRERYQRARIPARFARKTLKGFRVEKGDGARRRILEAASAYASSFTPDIERGLLLRGGTGVGKTHVAVGILIEVMRAGHTGLYYNTTDLLARLRESWGKTADATEAQLLEEMENVDLLVLDDLGAEAATDWVRDRLYLIINRRYEDSRLTIITTNADDAELRERVGPRIVSRLYEMCDRFEPFPDEDYRFAHMR